MTDLQNQVKKLQEEVDLLSDTITNMEAAARTVTVGGVSSAGGPLTPFPLNDRDSAVVRALTSASNYSISRDEYNKCTQTLETAFVPCESCDLVQRNLREVGEYVVSICSSQGLPSALAKFRARIEGLDWFTGNDVTRWTTEQNKDLARISKHLDGLYATIDPLKQDLDKANKKSKEAEKKMNEALLDIKLERETSSTERRQFEGRIDLLKKESQDKIAAVQKEKSVLEKGKAEFSRQIETLKSKLDEQRELLQVVG